MQFKYHLKSIKIRKIKSNVEDEKNKKLQLIEGVLNTFESNLAEISKSKSEKFNYLGEKVEIL